jgi:peptide/nickel transport system substrate-binding protein
MSMHSLRAGKRILLLAALIACRQSDSSGGDEVGGTLIIATGQEADALLPPLIETTGGRQAVDMLYLPIARLPESMSILGDSGFTAALADRWEWASDSLSLVFHLDPRARWSDGKPVRAEDVRFSLKAFRSPDVSADAAPNLANVDSVTVRDPATFIVWYASRSATQFYDVAHDLVPFPEHVYGAIPFDSLRSSPAARAPVGSGKFRLAKWEPGISVEVVADTLHWSGRPKLDRIVWLPIPDPTTQVAKLVTGEADMIELLRGPALDQAAKDSMLQFVRRPSFDFAMALFNLRDPRDRSRPHALFGDAGLRRALSLAVDREGLVRNVLDTVGVPMKSPFLSAFGIPGGILPPSDTAAAARALDSLGWRDTNGDGIRERDGRDLAFSIGAPTTSDARVRATVIMQEAFRRIGARVTVDHTENAVHTANTAAGRFDISVMGYSSGPPPARIRQYWRSDQKGQGSNFGLYENRAFDATVDSAVSTVNGAISRALFSRAAEMLAHDAPAIWLYELRAISGIHKRFRPASMRADAWWSRLDEWTVDPRQAIDRDRLGVRGVP